MNAGSVGKPKDGDPRACYVVIDTAGEVSVEFRRIPYDVQAVAAAIRESELPDKFAADLETAGPSASLAEPIELRRILQGAHVTRQQRAIPDENLHAYTPGDGCNSG